MPVPLSLIFIHRGMLDCSRLFGSIPAQHKKGSIWHQWGAKSCCSVKWISIKKTQRCGLYCLEFPRQYNKHPVHFLRLNFPKSKLLQETRILKVRSKINLIRRSPTCLFFFHGGYKTSRVSWRLLLYGPFFYNSSNFTKLNDLLARRISVVNLPPQSNFT